MELRPRELALGGLFGAAALVLPFIFHLLSLGKTFLPMYLPLMALAFFTRPAVAAATAFIAPLLSALLTGMPPLYPPTAISMAIELPIMAAAIAWIWMRWQRSVLAVLVPVLTAGRILQFGLHYLMGLILDLPPEFFSIASQISSLPGIVLMIVVIPSLYRTVHRYHTTARPTEQELADPRVSYFDSLADQWEELIPVAELLPRLREGLRKLGVGPDEHILDLGCGSGILLGTILEHIGLEGRVEAVDFAPRMIARASEKHTDGRVRFHLAQATDVPLPARSVDRVICFSAWPHFTRPDDVITEMHRLLRPGGRVHIWHADSRDTINDIHRNAGDAVRDDMLVPAEELARLFSSAGFKVDDVIDSSDCYLVSATRSRYT